MGDGLKISKDKRHRSSSSLAGAGLDGTRSERKLDIRALIPEVDDHFAVAELRCDDLQEKIDLVKLLKRKKKLNKRSMTRVTDTPTVSDNVPFISVRTQPKKKVSQQGARTRRMEVSTNPARGYIDPATVEQHRMLGQVWGYGRTYNHQNESQPEQKPYARTRPRRNRADGDGMCGLGVDNASIPAEVACGQDEDANGFSDLEIYDRTPGELFSSGADTNMYMMKKRKNITKRNEAVDDKNSVDPLNLTRDKAPWKNQNLCTPNVRRRQKQQLTQQQQQNQQQGNAPKQKLEERPVVELFNKNASRNSSPRTIRSAKPGAKKEDKRTVKHTQNGDQGNLKAGTSSDISVRSVKKASVLVRRKIRNRNYELPTVASQLKQADARYHYAVTNCSNIPFIVSKSTAPSHNIGINIQQVLNGVKMQQPVNGIPMTIAHHMGLGHVSSYKKANKTSKPSLNKSVINVITLGRRMLTLPSYRSISYNRLLSMYREGDGMVPRFLRAISRPNYIYTSMYDLTNREEIDVTSTCKARPQGPKRPSSVDDDTKRRLAEYADVYAEYEKLDALRKQGGHGSIEAERRCDELLRDLLAREETIKQVFERGPLPRKTLTSTTLVGTGVTLSERTCDSYHQFKLMDNMNAAGTQNGLNINEMCSSTAAIKEARHAKRDQT